MRVLYIILAFILMFGIIVFSTWLEDVPEDGFWIFRNGRWYKVGNEMRDMWQNVPTGKRSCNVLFQANERVRSAEQRPGRRTSNTVNGAAKCSYLIAVLRSSVAPPMLKRLQKVKSLPM